MSKWSSSAPPRGRAPYMPSADQVTAESYRLEADKLLAMAEAARFAETRQSLLELAQRYQALARRHEQRKRRGPASRD